MVSSEVLTQKLNAEQEHVKELNNALERHQEERSVATESLDRAHAEEMSIVENKVKKALHAKDEQIKLLTTRCTMLETELESIQDSLRKLT